MRLGILPSSHLKKLQTILSNCFTILTCISMNIQCIYTITRCNPLVIIKCCEYFYRTFLLRHALLIRCYESLGLHSFNPVRRQQRGMMMYTKGSEIADWMGLADSAVWSAVPRISGLTDLHTVHRPLPSAHHVHTSYALLIHSIDDCCCDPRISACIGTWGGGGHTKLVIFY